MKLDLRESQQAHRLARKGRQQELRDNMQAAAGKSFDSLRRDLITAEHEETHRAESLASLHGQPRVLCDMRIARIRSKWARKEWALSDMESRACFINNRWDSHMDDLNAADRDKLCWWGNMMLPENAGVINYIGTLPVSLYTSDAADDRQCVDLGGRRIIKKKKVVSGGGNSVKIPCCSEFN